MFDYLMAGLAVIASDLPSLREVIKRSRGGLCFEPGNSNDLADKIMTLRDDRMLRMRFAANARLFAITVANREAEMVRFQNAFTEVIAGSRTGA